MNFYVLELDFKKKKYLSFDYKDPTPYIGLNNSSKIKRGKFDADEILHLIKNRGELFDPVLKGTLVPLINNEVKEVFERTGLTGWKSTPVKLEIKRGQFNYDYHRLFIIGAIGPILYDDAPILEKTVDLGYQMYKKKYKKGLILDLNTWDGTDFFMSTDTSGYIIISEKAKETIELTKTDNVIITPVQELEVFADNKTQH